MGEAEKPLPVSLWSDDKLRPWTMAPELDEKLKEQNSILQDMMQNTSGSRIAGGRGLSILDDKPASFKEFEKMITDPQWMHKLGSAESDAEAEALLEELARLAQGDEAAAVEAAVADGGPETAIAGHTADDKLLLHSILEFNSALYDGDGPAAAPPSARNSARGSAPTSSRKDSQGSDSSIRLTKRPAKKKVLPLNDLGTVKYKNRANPAILNVSTAKFQEMMSRFNLKKSKSESVLRLGSDGRATYAAPASNAVETEAAALMSMDKDQLVAMLLKERGMTPDQGSSSQAPSVSSFIEPKAKTPPLSLEPLDLEAARAVTASGASARSARSSSASARGVEAGAKAAANGLPTVPESSELSVAEANISTNPSKPGSSGLQRRLEEEQELSAKQQSGNNLLAPIKIPTSPIKQSRQGSARPSSSVVPPSAQSGLLNLSSDATGSSSFAIPSARDDGSPKKKPSRMPTPRVSARGPVAVLGKSASAPVLGAPESARGPSTTTSALDKLSISGKMGTTNSLSKARLKDIRALRDHLLTTAGSFALNVNPESSPDAQAEVQESIAVTREMVAATMAKNRVDQTWDLITTPGYYEAVGPGDIFKSDIHNNFVAGPSFDKAVREADRYNPNQKEKRGIKSDKLKRWAEDGKKNNIEIFAAGGAMRMS